VLDLRANWCLVDLFEKSGLPSSHIIKWDIQETSAKPGPYREIVDAGMLSIRTRSLRLLTKANFDKDIFVNCIYLAEPIAPFLDTKSLSITDCNLSVIVDISCDTTNQHNQISVYSTHTVFTAPTVPVELPRGGPPLNIISIDHLPSLLPRESSEAFSGDLLPYLLQLDDWRAAPMWSGALDLYNQKVATLPAGMTEKE
jgi:saccharopine dehydrogenase (NAD+, L-lysine-forming)